MPEPRRVIWKACSIQLGTSVWRHYFSHPFFKQKKKTPTQLRDLILIGDSLKEEGKFSKKPFMEDLVLPDGFEGSQSLRSTLANI